MLTPPLASERSSDVSDIHQIFTPSRALLAAMAHHAAAHMATEGERVVDVLARHAGGMSEPLQATLQGPSHYINYEARTVRYNSNIGYV